MGTDFRRSIADLGKDDDLGIGDALPMFNFSGKMSTFPSFGARCYECMFAGAFCQQHWGRYQNNHDVIHVAPGRYGAFHHGLSEAMMVKLEEEYAKLGVTNTMRLYERDI